MKHKSTALVGVLLTSLAAGALSHVAIVLQCAAPAVLSGAVQRDEAATTSDLNHAHFSISD
jgi:hypothetical protein